MSKTPSIDIRPDHWEIVRAILEKHVPQYEVWAFGSRAKWTAKEFSDLDLAIITEKPLPVKVNAELSEAFEESDLPYKVDVVDWAVTGEGFKRIISQQKVLAHHIEPNMLEGWATMSLSEAGVSLIDCDHKTPPTEDDGFPYVAIPQIKNGRIDIYSARKISAKNFNEWTKKASPQPYDVVLSRRCNPGETAYVAPGTQFALGQNLVLLRANKDLTFPPYLRWLARSSMWWQQVEKYINVGAVFNSLKCADIPKFQLPFPPYIEQRAIAHILGTLDDKIECNRRMNETLEAMARAIFKDWFVDFSPTRAKMEGRQPEGLSPEVAALFPDRLDDEGKPEGWEIKALDEIAEFLNGLALQKYPQANIDASLPVIKIAELRAGNISSNSDRAAVSIESKYIVEAGDILFSWSGSLLLDVWTGSNGALNQHLFKVTSRFYPVWFHFYWIFVHMPTFQAIAKTKATTMGHIQRHHLAEALVYVPTSDLISVGDEIIGAFFAKIVQNRIYSQALATLRDTLLPKLVSGELRVKDAEKFVAEALDA